VLEGCAFGFRYVLDALRNAGARVEALQACGGASTSDLWLQIISDVCNVPLMRSDITEATCLGSAMLAGMATGVYDDASDAAASIATNPVAIVPRAEHSSRYQPLYELFRQVNEALNDCFIELARV
jgi:sugar (pentulose or hexulose) kinase